jgi:hypothetical protein
VVVPATLERQDLIGVLGVRLVVVELDPRSVSLLDPSVWSSLPGSVRLVTRNILPGGVRLVTRNILSRGVSGWLRGTYWLSSTRHSRGVSDWLHGTYWLCHQLMCFDYVFCKSVLTIRMRFAK